MDILGDHYWTSCSDQWSEIEGQTVLEAEADEWGWDQSFQVVYTPLFSLNLLFTPRRICEVDFFFPSKKITWPTLSHLFCEQWLESSESKNKDLFSIFSYIPLENKINNWAGVCEITFFILLA